MDVQVTQRCCNVGVCDGCSDPLCECGECRGSMSGDVVRFEVPVFVVATDGEMMFCPPCAATLLQELLRVLGGRDGRAKIKAYFEERRRNTATEVERAATRAARLRVGPTS